MKQLFPILLLSIFALGFFGLAAAAEKPRVFVLTDIENEPDDAMSMVRFLVYANQWDVEGLVADDVGSPEEQGGRVAHPRNRRCLRARCATTSSFTSRAFPARCAALGHRRRPARLGMAAVGEGMDSSGSELLIKAVDREDRAAVLGAGLGRAERARAGAVEGPRHALGQAAAAVRRQAARLYDLRSGRQRRRGSARLFPTCSTSPARGSRGRRISLLDLERHQRRQIPWALRWRGFFHRRQSLARREHSSAKARWARNIRTSKFLMEGDTPSFLNLIDNGLSNPEHPDWGGWGGRYEFYTPRMRKWFSNPKRDHSGPMPTMRCWAWMATGTPPIRRRSGAGAQPSRMISPRAWTGPSRPTPRRITRRSPASRIPIGSPPKPGDRITLSAEGSTDPDGNRLFYIWSYYPEAGTLSVATGRSGEPVTIENANARDASFIVPKNFLKAGTMHIILAVTDDGTPALTRYRRVIVTVPAT